MADVYAIFGTLLALGIAFPGMLTAWSLLFPGVVRRAAARIEETPGRSFGLGLLSAMVLAVPIAVLFALPLGPAKFMGGVLLMASLTLASMGAAGVAAAMAAVIARQTGERFSPLGAFVRGAIALELAAAFPFIGWFIFIPLTVIVSLGAAVFGILRWQPKPAAVAGIEMEGALVHEPQSA